MATIEIKRLSKSYGNHAIIHEMNLEIRRGQFVVIVGPSGCGKSTLLRMIAGLEEVTQGDIIINGELINDTPAKNRNIAMVFQNYALYPHMTVYNNMAYGLKMRGFSKVEIEKRVSKTAAILQLEPYLHRKPKELSGGQRQRVAMGRAIVREPILFLFDEPLSNLDAKLRMEMRLQIYQLQRQLNITSLYVTHDQVEAMTLADILVVMNKGKVEQIGKPLDIYHRPNSIFVASFIGSPSMNFLPAKIVASGNQLILAGVQSYPIYAPILADYQQSDIIVGIRPEKIRIAIPEDKEQFKVRVNVVEALGSDTIIYATIVGTEQKITLKLDGHIRTHAGEIMAVACRFSDFQFFDRTTEQRIHTGY